MECIVKVYNMKLNESQIFAIIDRYYPPTKDTAINNALINVFFNDYSVYKAEKHSGLNSNTLIKKVNRIKKEIEFIENIIKSR